MSGCWQLEVALFELLPAQSIVINIIIILLVIFIILLFFLIIIIITRPRPAFGRLGLGGSSRGYTSNG